MWEGLHSQGPRDQLVFNGSNLWPRAPDTAEWTFSHQICVTLPWNDTAFPAQPGDKGKPGSSP